MSNQPFDNKLDRAIQTTNAEDAFKFVYEEDEESRYSLTVLEDIARSTATFYSKMLRFRWKVKKNHLN